VANLDLPSRGAYTESVIHSCRPAPALRSLVRYYYQVEYSLEQLAIQRVPARSPQILEFMFGTFYQVHRLDRNLIESAAPVALVGAKTRRRVDLGLHGSVDAFTIVFRPGGLKALFGLPVAELTDLDFNAEDVIGRVASDFYCRLGEVSSFAARSRIADEYLLSLRPRLDAGSGIVKAAAVIECLEGNLGVAELALRAGLGMRQFERRFQREIGIAPKLYSRIVRFEAALRYKSKQPARRWTDIAHALGYHDQMHMVHDFRSLSGTTPGAICQEVDMFVKPEADSGDLWLRPPALDRSHFLSRAHRRLAT
jgi:AraC-like DNA-binding protein